MENLLTIQNLYTEYATDHGLVQAVNGVSLTDPVPSGAN